jgi:putative transcriptional regulator
MTKEVFEQISAGLNEALSVAKGVTDPVSHYLAGTLDVKAIRIKTGLTQKEFAMTYGFGIDQIRQWEQGRVQPVQGTKAYLMLINKDPAYVANSLMQIAS